MSDAETRDFLFTWKPDKWDYTKLKALVDRFDSGETVIYPWRCRSHQQVRVGSNAYLYKQGDPPNGIFGIAQVVDQAKKRAIVLEGESEYEVSLRFELLLDPTVERFIMTKEQIQVLSEPIHLNTQSSGISIPSRVARAIDAAAERDFRNVRPMGRRTRDHDPLPPDKRERLTEVYDRDQGIVNELKRLHGGRCQICDSEPFNGLFGSIVEGHHIEWLSRGGRDVRENVVLLCPNHHAAVHAADPIFDRAELVFRFGTKAVPIRLTGHLKRI